MTATRTLLLTGFQAFGGEQENPSWQAVSALHGTRIAGHRVVARELPVAFGDALKALRVALRDTRPALAVCVGQAAGRAQISLERVAINVDDARIPDNAGKQPVDVPVVAGGPAAYFATLPIKAMRQALQEAGFPAGISQTAGTFVCNHVFYGLMHALRTQRHVRAGFIHLPYSPAQAARHPGAPSLAVETATGALRIALQAALRVREDARLPGGAEH
ncbi:MAG TPA: pyroglutamyl-peptidase I [Pseudoxanthomonas sp.]|nr:pyroglutamyl-peptidase I [Pseudoxanthomonas sp.]